MSYKIFVSQRKFRYLTIFENSYLRYDNSLFYVDPKNTTSISILIQLTLDNSTTRKLEHHGSLNIFLCRLYEFLELLLPSFD